MSFVTKLIIILSLILIVYSEEYQISRHYSITNDMLGNLNSDKTVLKCNDGDKILHVEIGDMKYLHGKYFSKDYSTVRLVFFKHIKRENLAIIKNKKKENFIINDKKKYKITIVCNKNFSIIR